MDEVVPGILHWKAKHPSIGMEVDSHLIADCGLALDPILPEGEGPDWLGHDVERIVLTVRHHRRSAPEFGVPVLAHSSGLHEFEDDDDLEVSGYDAGDELAPGIRVLPFGRICPDDAVLHLDRGPGVLAFGDGIVNYDGIRFVPDHLLGDDPERIKAELFAGLVPLLDEDFDALLFAHGDPIPSGGKAMLREFVDSRDAP
jgi:hypothetical protein